MSEGSLRLWRRLDGARAGESAETARCDEKLRPPTVFSAMPFHKTPEYFDKELAIEVMNTGCQYMRTHTIIFLVAFIDAEGHATQKIHVFEAFSMTAGIC